MRNHRWRVGAGTSVSGYLFVLLLWGVLVASPIALFRVVLAQGGASPLPRGDGPAAAAAPSPEQATPPRAGSEPVTLKGQVVCSGCWGEADRSKVRYGTDADRKCALACGKKGIPAGLALKTSGEFELVLLAPGALTLGDKGWMPWMGKYVSATGSVAASEGKRALVLVALREITSAEAGFGN